MKSNKKLKDIHFGHAVIVGFSNIRILFKALRCVFVVFHDFFYSQSPLRPRRKRPPYVWIDHDLDLNIPFAPEWVDIYIGFIKLWVTALTWTRYRFGRKAIPFVNRHIEGMRKLYKEASRVYWTCQSTTERPPAVEGNRTFATIHKLDPHLNCLPSLHVMVVIYAGYHIANEMEELFGKENCREEAAYIREMAFLITESILYVKQHSVNCIPAALFALKQMYPGIEEEYGEEFLRSLFRVSKPEIKDHPAVSRYMVDLYHLFQKQWESGEFQTYQDVLIEFLSKCPSECRCLTKPVLVESNS